MKYYKISMWKPTEKFWQLCGSSIVTIWDFRVRRNELDYQGYQAVVINFKLLFYAPVKYLIQYDYPTKAPQQFLLLTENSSFFALISRSIKFEISQLKFTESELLSLNIFLPFWRIYALSYDLNSFSCYDNSCFLPIGI